MNANADAARNEGTDSTGARKCSVEKLWGLKALLTTYVPHFSGLVTLFLPQYSPIALTYNFKMK